MLYPNATQTRPAVSSPFGPRAGGAFSFHYGADLVGFSQIHAVAAGRVTFAGWMNDAAGNTIIIDHGGGVTSVYMHNASHAVTRGENVAEGQLIAVMGSTGNATGNCNHLEIRLQGTSVEPLAYIAARLTTESELGEEEMALIEYINVSGAPGKRRGGTYGIMRLTPGAALTAQFISPKATAGVPTLSGDREIAEMQKKIPGLL